MVRILAIFLFIAGCSSSPSREGGGGSWRMPYGDENSQAPGEAFAGDMSIRKDMPTRPANFKPFDFYYKRCSINGNETYYSKTSYDCNLPGF